MTDQLEIKPFASISPSSYTASQDCLLRAAAGNARCRPLLPASPRAMFGSVIHKLLENAHRTDGSEAALLELWEACENQVCESTLERNPLQSRFVPLEQHIFGYEKDKWKAIFQAQKQTAMSARDGVALSENSAACYEVTLQTPDGSVKGQIDYLGETPDGLIVRDTKTGRIWEDETASPPVLKAAYQTQLRLYAALVSVCRNRWPVRLEIVPFSGEPVEVEFNPAQCLQLLDDAKNSLAKWNEEIGDAHKSGDLAPLATPSGSCAYCAFRPACAAYWQARPKLLYLDVRGKIKALNLANNGNLLLDLCDSHGQDYRIVLNRDFKNSVEEWKVNIGDEVQLYNLREQSDGVWTQTVLTHVILLSSRAAQKQ